MTGNGDLDPVGKHNEVLAWRSRARTGVACAETATAVAQAGSKGEADQSEKKKQELKADSLKWMIYSS